MASWAAMAFVAVTWVFLEQGALSAVLAALAVWPLMPEDP
jgi:hypothetical protein